MAISNSEKTQKDVADFLGIKAPTLNERLKKGKFSTSEMIDICKFIGCEYIEKIKLDNGAEI